MSKLGAKPYMISAVGVDIAGVHTGFVTSLLFNIFFLIHSQNSISVHVEVLLRIRKVLYVPEFSSLA